MVLRAFLKHKHGERKGLKQRWKQRSLPSHKCCNTSQPSMNERGTMPPFLHHPTQLHHHLMQLWSGKSWPHDDSNRFPTHSWGRPCWLVDCPSPSNRQSDLLGQLYMLAGGWNTLLVVCWVRCPLRSSSEENFSGCRDFSLGVNMGSDSIPKNFRMRV